MALIARAKVFHTKAAKTRYLTIPSAIASDSAFPFDSTNEALIVLIPNKGLLVIPPDRDFLVEEAGTTICLRDKPESA